MGTTSACAENTARPHRCGARYRNYLRVRGEYSRPKPLNSLIAELPPRARRIPMAPPAIETKEGTTSACAENTWRTRTWTLTSGNYLRVRGEYTNSHSHTAGKTELPPRARRIPAGTTVRACGSGTTSACAENTKDRLEGKPDAGNYLRVRGEYRLRCPPRSNGLELPPRARRIPLILMRIAPMERTTSACAENTLLGLQAPTLFGNYLRVRGEYFVQPI